MGNDLSVHGCKDFRRAWCAWFPLLRKIIQIPGLLVIRNEHNASYRQIFTDGRPMRADPNPPWNGDSSAKWEGDTLVVETIGFRDGLWLDTGGSPLTDAAKVTEKFRRAHYGTLQVELTVDDAKAYTRPWTIKLTQMSSRPTPNSWTTFASKTNGTFSTCPKRSSRTVPRPLLAAAPRSRMGQDRPAQTPFPAATYRS